MLIYHNNSNASNLIDRNLKNKRNIYIMKKKKNNYKSMSYHMPKVIRTKVLELEGRKNFRALKKKISKKNIRFLKDLGFKVNQQ